ncbi:Glutaminyl-tRNA synthetase [Nitrospina gracilis 3/211]|uniref:Glutamine--tRNA ligase n=1 Tax=Nitrospina gracilis (strain 3/211) TaxID=1266370 RepID=M1YZJ5_NITG3|nr:MULTISPECIES: glutamine--tRNA ligase/YqeY domain fusion protein [Nitrospina]MCF8723818.1 glutaminyl-tRNA synthetase [Nitrospina sp. Nb-3]CCQ90926.1 Glutaminyl-tRNA synthetase [Nitrospina gracilis 3/211]
MNESRNPSDTSEESTQPSHFVRRHIQEDNASGRFGGKVVTRFPPEPNGFLHIGHAKSVCLNFGMALEFGGHCNLRFDDTNPIKEEAAYVESIKEDVRWLGFDWGDKEYFASDNFQQLYDWAVQLIESGKAYVDDLNADQIREYRGTLSEPGKDSPHRNRTVEENLDLFERMKNGEFDTGAKVLRAKIDMASGNLNLRDPVLYRILKAPHHRTGDAWCIYPMYDWAHGQSDSIEGVTHSICTLEFEDHRPLYDWCLDALGVFHPRQIEFARLNLTHTVLSKRKLLQLVKEGYVDGWDDPRMPTVSGLRRRGYTPESIRDFCERIGVAKSNSTVELGLLEFCIREHLNMIATRVMAVLHPLKVVITNYPEGQVEDLQAENNPEDATAGHRTVPFSRELYIEQEDFMEIPPKKFFRLAPGREVRLKHAYIIKCEEVVKNDQGQVVELRCTYDPETKSGQTPDGRKVKGTLHWVSAPHAYDAEVRLYNHLFVNEDPDDIEIPASINPDSLEVLTDCKLEPSLKEAKLGDRFQFLRMGYFVTDSKYSKPGQPVFNRTVPLRDTWAKIQKKG